MPCNTAQNVRRSHVGTSPRHARPRPSVLWKLESSSLRVELVACRGMYYAKPSEVAHAIIKPDEFPSILRHCRLSVAVITNVLCCRLPITPMHNRSYARASTYRSEPSREKQQTGITSVPAPLPSHPPTRLQHGSSRLLLCSPPLLLHKHPITPHKHGR